MAKSKPKKAAPAAVRIRPPLVVSGTNRFEKDVELMKRRGEDMEKFKAVIEALASRVPLPPELKDHPLKGNWKGFRDCHVETDWVIIYEVTETDLILHRTGTHSDIFV